MLFLYLSMIESEADKSKFELLYETYRNLMYYVAYKVLLDEALAEDAVHNAFMRVIYCLDKIEDVECHKTKNFLVIIVKNIAIDLYRKRKQQGTAPLDDLEFSVGKSTLEEHMNVESLKEAIMQLPEKLRDVLELKCFYNYSNSEISKMLSIKEDAVRKRLERARTQLNILLEMSR